MRIGTSAESRAVSIVFSEYIFVRMDRTLDREFDIQNVKTKNFHPSAKDTKPRT